MDIKWHESVSTAAKNLITSDSHIVRIWNPRTVSCMLIISIEHHFFRTSGGVYVFVSKFGDKVLKGIVVVGAG